MAQQLNWAILNLWISIIIPSPSISVYSSNASSASKISILKICLMVYTDWYNSIRLADEKYPLES